MKFQSGFDFSFLISLIFIYLYSERKPNSFIHLTNTPEHGTIGITMEESTENNTKRRKTDRKPSNGNTTKLGSFESCKRWIDSLRRSKSTRRAYKFNLTKFCLHFKITPDELIKLPRPQIQTMFEDFVKYLTDFTAVKFR